MARMANPARGEVDITVDGEAYVLAGTFANMARLQGALGVTGLGAVLTMTAAADARAILEGMKALAVSGDVVKLETARFSTGLDAVQKALIAAISGPPEPDAGNAAAADATSQK